MVLSSKDNCWPSENLILKSGRKHYRTNIAPWHWQLRSLISAEGNGTLYFPTGSENNHITRLATDTCESETIHVLGFPPRCLAAQSGWVCCGGEYGEFAVIKDANQHGGDGNRTRTNVDDALSSNFQSQLRSLESPPGNDTSLSSSFSRDMFNLLEQRLNGPAKSWTSSSHKYGSERVNCITIWEPPGATSLFPARAGHYGTTVAVLSNNDKTVTMVGLQESEFLDEIKLPDCVNRSLISPDGTLLASICDDPFLYLHTRKATNGKIGDAYEWKSLPRVRLESPAKDARDDCRGSFAASFSPSGRYLAVGIQNGTIKVFDTAALQIADTDALVASFTTSRHPEVHGAVRDMAFCPGPYDLLAWTEHRGRIGVADARTNFAQRQTIILDQKADFEHLSLTDRSTIDPRLLDQRNERSSRAGSTLHLARLLSQANSPQPPHASTNVDITSRVNRPFSPEETAILDAVSNERRRREARDTRDARDLIAEDLRASTSWRPHVWAERRETLARILDRDRRESHRPAGVQTSSEQERERRAPTPRRRTSIMQAISQETDRMAGVAPPTLNRMQSSGNNEQSNSPPDSPSPLVADSGVPQPFIPGRLTSGWADLEALYNITGNDETPGLESIRVPPSRTRRAIPVINDGWNDELTGFGTRRSYPNPRLSSRDHTQNPDDTAGLTWSEDGQTLWVGAEDGVYEFKVNLLGRKVFPEIQLR
ncbi:hypothetical protein PFICI_04459 [Pestalotiopsis fici W106-1]|uniref:DUF2415 domain-containing protein n=1 Tax=Pestalotiopsis fici (strain W106-1 / CGMCC3.15140) TaxID=1229662 RepID=W3X8Y2_PESFW|nr:uncharacterized protein PFICI_04459 [Pestalotiopsis fici W106-1]ETS82583.1 hypothetical protein PFICI_04459 [Pestalotiopsis fici W106-1]